MLKHRLKSLKASLFLVALILLPAIGFSQTPVPMVSQSGLTYTENFADIANWANSASAGSGYTIGTGATRWASVATGTGTIPNATATTTATTTFTTGASSAGVQRGSLSGNVPGTLVLLTTGTTNNTTACAVDFFMDYSGTNADSLFFDAATVINSSGNRVSSLKVYWSINGTTFTELTAANLPFVATNNVSASANIRVKLPSAFNNTSTCRLRFYYHNGTGGSSGSRPKISIDNVTVTAANNPTVDITDAHPVTGNINQNSTNNIVGSLQLAVSNANATLNGVSFTTSGTYTLSDIQSNGFKVWINNTNDLAGATQLGASQASVASGGTISVSGLTQTISNGTTRYLLLTANIASGASIGNTIGVSTTAFSNISIGGTPTKVGTDPVAASNLQTIAAITPSISLSNATAPITNPAQGTSNVVLYRVDISVANIAAVLNSIQFTTSGTYTASDVSNFKIWYHTNSSFTTGTPILIDTKSTGLGSGLKTFSGLSQSFAIGTNYIFLTTDLPCLAGLNVIQVDAISNSDLSFASGSVSGSGYNASAVSLSSATANDVTNNIASAGNTQATVSWTLPTGCYDEVMLVVKPNTSISASPFGTSYNVNSQSFTDPSNDVFDATGAVVYKGTGTSTTVTSLTNLTTYYFKLFTRSGSNWSAGVEVNAMPDVTGYFWNGGNINSNPAAGGKGIWGGTNVWRQPTSTGSQSGWVDGNRAVFAGTGDTVTLDASRTASSVNFNTTDYTLACTSTQTLTGSIALANNVNLNLAANVKPFPASFQSNGTMGIGSVSGTGTAGLTLLSATSSTAVAQRINLAATNTVISVPTTIAALTGSPGNLSAVGYVGNATGTSIASNATITNNTGSIKTMLGATSGNDITVNSIITGSSDLIFQTGSNGGGAGTITLNAANTYRGATIFNSSTTATIKLGVNNALPTSTDVTIGYLTGTGGILDLNGYNQEISSLTTVAGGGSITNTGLFSDTLTISGSGRPNAFGLVISDGGPTKKITLVRKGSGSTKLSGANTYTGGTIIYSDSLIIGAAGVLANTGAIILEGGTFATGSAGTAGFTETVGTLTLNANANIGLGSGNHSLIFANSSAITWNAAAILTIYGWVGTAGYTGTEGKLFFGNSIAGLSSTQLAQITFAGFNPGAQILPSGEIVPLPALPTLTFNDNGAQPTAGNITLSSTNNIIQTFVINEGNSNSGILSQLTVPLSGNYLAADISANGIKLYASNTNSFLTATAISSKTPTSTGTGETITFSSLSDTVSQNTSRYYWITVNVAATADTSRNINANALTASNFSFVLGAPSGNISAAGLQNFAAIPPSIAFSNGAAQATNPNQGHTNVELYRVDFAVTNAATTLNAIQFTTSGSYSASDLNNIKLWYHNNASLTTGTPVLLSTKTTNLGAGAINFTGLTQSFDVGTNYVFLTADISCGSIVNNTIEVNAISTADVILSAGTKSGSGFTTGGVLTINAANPNGITSLVPTAANLQTTLNWVVPAGCYDQVMVVAKPLNSIGTAPSGDGSAYIANSSSFSNILNSTFDTTGVVIYKGTASSVVVTGLTNGTQYFFKVFTRLGTTWSAGFEVDATPILTGYFWNGATNTAKPAMGGSGQWVTANNWRQPSDTGAQATWANSNNAIFQGNPGFVTIGSTAVSPTRSYFNTSGYTLLTDANTTTRSHNGPIQLADGVKLYLMDSTLSANGASSSRTLNIGGSILGGVGSSLTILGGQSSGGITRVNLSSASSSINVPVTIYGQTNSNSYGQIGLVATAAGVNLTTNATIFNNTSYNTILGATGGNDITLNGVISGSAGLQFQAGAPGGAGTINLNAQNTYTGATFFNMSSSGVVKLGANNALPTITDLTMGYSSTFGGILDLNGKNQTVSSLRSDIGVGSIRNNGNTDAILTINGSFTPTMPYGFVIANGTTNKTALVRSGTGTLKLSGSNTFTGGTSITGGTIQMGASNVFANAGAMDLSGGNLSTGATVGFTDTLGLLTLTDNSSISLGSGTHYLVFANSSSANWVTGKTLTINGWSGTTGSAGTAGRIFIGNNNTGLSAAQLAQISFAGFPNPGAIILSNGEIVPNTSSGNINVSVIAFLQGLYSGNGTLIAAPFNSDGVSPTNISDTVTIEIRDGVSGGLVLALPAILSTNGVANFSISNSFSGLSYYIVLKHRNSVATWSAAPVLFSALGTSYDFTTSDTKAYGSNLLNNAGIYLIYSGDINQDGAVDFNDYPNLDISSSTGVLGYDANDLNGDASVDFNDYPIIDVNSSNGVIAVSPF
jgi:autotransporter-associated beta strand protein